MADIQFNVDAALAKIEQLIQAHGQQAVDAAVAVERMNGINTLVSAAGFAVLAGGFAKLATWLNGKRPSGDEILENPLPAIGTCVAWLAACGCGVGVVVQLFDAWAWTAIFNPKLALAHDILSHLAGIQ